MAATPVNPSKKRVNVTWTVGDDKYQSSVSAGFTKGTLFTLMGYTDKGESDEAGAIILDRSDAIANGLLIKMIARCKEGTRRVSRTIYVPTNKIEDTVKGAKGKTIGSAQVLKVVSPRKRTYS